MDLAGHTCSPFRARARCERMPPEFIADATSRDYGTLGTVLETSSSRKMTRRASHVTQDEGCWTSECRTFSMWQKGCSCVPVIAIPNLNLASIKHKLAPNVQLCATVLRSCTLQCMLFVHSLSRITSLSASDPRLQKRQYQPVKCPATSACQCRLPPSLVSSASIWSMPARIYSA